MLGKIDIAATPAEYFAGCVVLAVDFLNGGSGFNRLAREALGARAESIEADISKKSALVMFLSTLHEHPSFSADRVGKISDPNFGFYQEIARILPLGVDDPEANRRFVAALRTFKVAGLKKISITEKFGREGRIFYEAFLSESAIATKEQPYGPYADAYSSPF